MQSAAIWAYIERFSAQLASPQPETLFHYTPADSALSILGTAELWGAAFQYLRSGSESKRSLGVALYLIKQRLSEVTSAALSSERVRRSLCDTPTLRRTIFEAEVLVQVQTQLEAYLSSELAVVLASLSAKPDDRAQWQRYCPAGGYALGFAADALALLAGAQHYTLLPCFYGSWEEHDEIIQGAFMGSMQAWVGQVEEVYTSVSNLHRAWEQCKGIVAQEAARITATLLQVALLLRHETYRHEEEWCLVGETLALSGLEYREKQGLMVPYQAFRLTDATLGLAYLPLNQVIVGTHDQRDLACQGVRGLLSKHGLASQIPSIAAAQSEWQAQDLLPKDAGHREVAQGKRRYPQAGYAHLQTSSKPAFS